MYHLQFPRAGPTLTADLSGVILLSWGDIYLIMLSWGVSALNQSGQRTTPNWNIPSQHIPPPQWGVPQPPGHGLPAGALPCSK